MSSSECAAQVVRRLDALRFEADLERSIAELGGAASDAARSEDSDEHHATEVIMKLAVPFLSLAVDGNPHAATEDARVRTLELRGQLTSIRARLRALQRDALVLGTRLAGTGVPDAVSRAVGSFEPAVIALRTQFDALGGRAAASRTAAETHDRAADADHTLGMNVLRIAPAALGMPGGVPELEFEVGVGAGFVYGAGDAIRDLFVGAYDMLVLAKSSVRSLAFGGGVGYAVDSAEHLKVLLERAPDIASVLGGELATEWREAGVYGKGELIGKIHGYVAMTAALALASGTESLQAELAANGSRLAVYALRLLALADAAANPASYVHSIAKLAKFPDAVIEWLTRASRARKAAEAVRAAEQVAAEVAQKAARAWAETAEGARVVAALERGGASGDLLVALTDVQRARLPAIHALIAKGDIRYAITAVDELVAGGLDRTIASTIEDSLAKAEGKTPPSVYRNPIATVPNSKDPDKPLQVKPAGTALDQFYGTDEVSPEKVFADGLDGRGPNVSLDQHVRETKESAFRGTTERIFDNREGAGGAGAWAGEGGWVYEIDGVPMWDANQLLEGRMQRVDGSFGGNPYAGEHEHSILANVPTERIRGAYPIVRKDGGLAFEPMIPNPHYRPLTGT